VAIVDTNCNPDDIDYPIPANDDAIRAIKLICTKIADAVMEGKSGITAIPTEAAEEEGLAEAEMEAVTEAMEMNEPFIFTPDEE